MAATNGANGQHQTGQNGVSLDVSKPLPNSQKVLVEGPGGVRVPVREISLSGGEPPMRVYDTSGPQGHPVREGLPRLGEPWILARGGIQEVEPSYKPISGYSDAKIPATLRRPVL